MGVCKLLANKTRGLTPVDGAVVLFATTLVVMVVVQMSVATADLVVVDSAAGVVQSMLPVADGEFQCGQSYYKGQTLDQSIMTALQPFSVSLVNFECQQTKVIATLKKRAAEREYEFFVR